MVGRLGLSGLRKKALTTDVMADSIHEARNAMDESKDTLDLMIKTLGYTRKVCGEENTTRLLNEITSLYSEFLKKIEGKTPEQCRVIERTYTKKAADIVDRYVTGPSDLPTIAKAVFKKKGIRVAIATVGGLVLGLATYSAVSESIAAAAWRETMGSFWYRSSWMWSSSGYAAKRPPFSLYMGPKSSRFSRLGRIYGDYRLMWEPSKTKAFQNRFKRLLSKCVKIGGVAGAVIGVALFVAPELIELGKEKYKEKKIRKGLWRPGKVVPEKVIPREKK